MLPFNKAQWYIGYSSLSLMNEQDRRHWLLKTDRVKQITNGDTGSMFHGQIDNQGSFIDVSTQKLSSKHPILKNFIPNEFKTIFELNPSSLPFSYDVNGLCCARITSIEYPYNSENKNYKIQFVDCEEVYIPFLNENNSYAYAFNFIKTNKPPRLLMMDGNGEYTISVEIVITIKDGVYYYPLDTFQPIEIENKGSGVYESVLINDNNFIGYPAFWFTCDETDVGPKISFNDTYRRFDFCGLDKRNPYSVNVYLMDKLDNDNDYVRVYPDTGYAFHGTDSDFNTPLDLNRIKYVYINQSSQLVTEDIKVQSYGNNVLYMYKTNSWSYNPYGYYECSIRDFNHNHTTPSLALTPIFRLDLDFTIPFEQTTTDIGFAGFDITAETQNNQYPFDLNKFSGLPEWILDSRESTQRLIVYAIHNTPNSSDENPESKQTAALILDPGVPYSQTNPDFDNSKIGRIYVLSNDDPTYVNNSIAEYPKPERTVARICDIPTSVAQLSNISGIAPTSIVDPKYVRSQASYSEEEKKRLFNGISSRWVRPIHKLRNGNTVMEEYPDTETNQHVFTSLAHLRLVDLLNHNDFREHLQLNQMVEASEVSLHMITNGGSDYRPNDVGNIIIGGFAFNYIVQTVDSDGSVTEVTIAPSSSQWNINISNFDMTEGTTGITQPYGTSPITGDGTGLKVQLRIANYTSKIPTLGNVYTDLFALCKNSQGLWLYVYSTEEEDWVKSICVSEYEVTRQGEVSTKDSYINSILPNVNMLPVSIKKPDEPETTLTVISSASYINVVDQTKYPISDGTRISELNVVDINRFYCDHVYTLTAQFKSFDHIIDLIKATHYDRFDSYIIWRWKEENNPNNKEFEFGIVHRSLNNYRSLDWKNSTLPPNELHHKNYVHSNASTTVTWDIQDYCMTLVWTFNPEAHVYESYSVDADTRELLVNRKKLKWEDIDIYTNNFKDKLPMTDSDDKMLWNIASNVMNASDIQTSRDPIYQQPAYRNIVRKGVDAYSIPDQYQPKGNWQLIFPRVQTLHFRTQSGHEYTAKDIHKLNVVKDVSIQERTDVMDINDAPINEKTLIINTNDNNTASIKVYNSTTGKWNDI